MGDLVYSPPVSAAPETIIWEWNQTDVSQFSGEGYGTPTGSLTVGNFPRTSPDTAVRPRLNYASTGTSGGYLYWINDLPAMPDRYIVEFTIGPREAGVGAGGSTHVAVAGQNYLRAILVGRGGSPFDDLNIVTLNGLAMNVGGAYRRLSTTHANDDNGLFCRVLADTRDPSSDDPGVQVTLLHPRATGTGVDMRATVSTDTSFTEFGTPGTEISVSGWNAAWQTGGTIKKVGVLFDELVNPGDQFLADFRILSI